MSYNDYLGEVIEDLCDLGGYSLEVATKLAIEKESDIRYAHQYRLSSSIIAGSILGINDCCIAPSALKP